MPKYNGEIYRIVHKKFNRKLYAVGNEITYPHFVSGSADWSLVDNFEQGTVFIIKSKTGRFIGKISQYTSDNEIILLPNTKFKVTSWCKGNVIALGQKNIRQSAYKLSNENITNLSQNNEPLIIEMIEI